MASPRTRDKNLSHPIIGSGQEMCESVLPTRLDVLKYYKYVWESEKVKTNGKNPAFLQVSKFVVDKLIFMWNKSSIPCVTSKTISDLLKNEVDLLQSLNKSHKRDKGKESFEKKLADFNNRSEGLFDVSACKCKDFQLCKCTPDKKVPILEREFLTDQRTVRKMAIGRVDIKVTLANTKKNARKIVEEERLCKKRREGHDTNLFGDKKNSLDLSDPPQDVSSISEDLGVVLEQPVPGPSSATTPNNQTRLTIPSFSRVCDRYGVPDRAAAALASALLHDVTSASSLENVTNELVIDRSKVRRERMKARHGVIKEINLESSNIQALYFDGRLDDTLRLNETEDGKLHRTTVKEDHISLIQEPKSRFLGYTAPLSGKAIDIANSILQYFSENYLTMSEIVCIGCDGCTTNTGKYNGVIRKLEEKLGRPLQWVICQLHSNELPLRHLVEMLDGPTDGPKGFVGPVGRSLKTCHTLKSVHFERIEFVIDQIDRGNTNDFSTDQQYLYDICNAVSCGKISQELENRSPGKLSHARWLTTANRILRLYVATTTPTQTLIELATFIVKVYAPSWFRIKCNPNVTNGATNLWETIKSCTYLSEESQTIAFKSIQNNAYFAHPENMLLSMLVDKREHIKKLALRRIINARSRKKSSKQVRRFHIPKINFGASEYIDMISWHDVEVTEPPLTRHLTTQDLQRLMKAENSNMISECTLFELPSHTQAVERAVKEVTASSKLVCDHKKRENLVKTRMFDRNIRPIYDTKKQFNC